MKTLLGLLLTLNILTAGCFSMHELKEDAFLELEGKIMFTFKGDTNCEAISNATVLINDQELSTNENGQVVFSLPEQAQGDLRIAVRKNGYIDFYEEQSMVAGSVWKKSFLMSKAMPPKSAKIVLSWAAKPTDLDLHLMSRNFHVSFREKTGDHKMVSLDQDSNKGYGPETIVIKEYDLQEEYEVLVNNFSKDSQKTSSLATVSVYQNNQLRLSQSVNLGLGECISVAVMKGNSIMPTLQASNKCSEL